MIFDINEGNVKWVVQNLNSACGNGQFSTAEVLVGLAQFTGAMIVTLAETPVSGFQVAETLGNEVKNSMVAGYTAKGYNMKPSA